MIPLREHLEREVQKIIENKGFYPGHEKRVVKIVQYNNYAGERQYRVLFEGEDYNKYKESFYVKDLRTIWEYKPITQQDTTSSVEDSAKKLAEIISDTTSILETISEIRAKLKGFQKYYLNKS